MASSDSHGGNTLSHEVTAAFCSLPTRGKVCLEYVWLTRLAGHHSNLGMVMKSKTRVVDRPPQGISQVEPWSSDALAANQGTATERFTDKTEVMLRPVAMAEDPFRGAPHKLVLCECVYPDGSPLPCNNRARAAKLMRSHVGDEPWFGIEQEYLLVQHDRKTPLGWPRDGVPPAQLTFVNYCGVGDTVGRDFMEAHLRACLAAGLAITGTNLEVTVGSCEYQLAPLAGVDAGDQLWLSRYILARIAEQYGIMATLDPKPLPDADGCGLHTNLSTKAMRAAGGLTHITAAMDKLRARHAEHMAVYGDGNEARLRGGVDYSKYEQFTCGVSDRSASVRIPPHVAREGRGYFEDRRPAANADPYLVTARLLATVMDESF